jgi:putative heme-binding domain-containing protein
MGPEGRQRAGTPESQTDPALKIAAYRAMRRANLDILPVAARLARDADAGVRRDVALSLRDLPADKTLDILVDIAKGYDGQDRSYLEALGTGADGKEPALYDRLKRELGVPADPLAWSGTFARIAWRLHVPAAVADLRTRAESEKLSMADRSLALDTIAFTKDRAASTAMIALANPQSAMKDQATWWLLNRMSNDWSEYDLRPALKTAGIYDPETIALREIVTPAAAPDLAEIPIDQVVALTGDAARGKATAARCVMCHAIGGTGADFGPALDGWGRGKSAEIVARAIVRPSAEVALGYDGTEIKTKDGLTIQGILLKTDDPLIMRSMGGVTQIIPADRVATRRRMSESLMMSGAQLGLTAQDVADLVAFLRGN